MRAKESQHVTYDQRDRTKWISNDKNQGSARGVRDARAPATPAPELPLLRRRSRPPQQGQVRTKGASPRLFRSAYIAEDFVSPVLLLGLRKKFRAAPAWHCAGATDQRAPAGPVVSASARRHERGRACPPRTTRRCYLGTHLQSTDRALRPRAPAAGVPHGVGDRRALAASPRALCHDLL